VDSAAAGSVAGSVDSAAVAVVGLAGSVVDEPVAVAVAGRGESANW
jgi:hypothetical protein